MECWWSIKSAETNDSYYSSVACLNREVFRTSWSTNGGTIETGGRYELAVGRDELAVGRNDLSERNEKGVGGLFLAGCMLTDGDREDRDRGERCLGTEVRRRNTKLGVHD